MAEVSKILPKGKIKPGAVFAVAGVALVTFVGIMYVKKCYVIIGGKRYGFNPNS